MAYGYKRRGRAGSRRKVRGRRRRSRVYSGRRRRGMRAPRPGKIGFRM